MNNSFRTIIKPEKYPFKINYDSKMMFLGSCFSENIGEKLEALRFDIDINPFGILYNPVSIKKSVDLLTHEIYFSEDNLFLHNDQWHSFFHHSKFSDINKGVALERINSRIKESSNNLKSIEYLFITFGTAWVYDNIETNDVVSNCHKLPANKFKRRLLNPDEITIEYFQLINSLQNYNPDIKIIFTISPIRHLKDGFFQNQLSKSILHIAINQIQEHYANCFYFPAFEIMNDDLRDYRFYTSDMLHPNETAINYLLEFFENSFFEKETIILKNEITKVLKSYNHRPFNLETNQFKEFAKKNILKIERIESLLERVKLDDIKEYFAKYI